MISLKFKFQLAKMQLIGRFDIVKLNEFQPEFDSNGNVDRCSRILLRETEMRMKKTLIQSFFAYGIKNCKNVQYVLSHLLHRIRKLQLKIYTVSYQLQYAHIFFMNFRKILLISLIIRSSIHPSIH